MIASLRDADETASPADEEEDEEALPPDMINGNTGAVVAARTERRGTLLMGTTALSQLGAFLSGGMVGVVHGPNGRPPSTWHL